jgi:hypothetical protein
MQKIDRSRDLYVKVNISKATALALTRSFVPDSTLPSAAASFHQIPDQRVPNKITCSEKRTSNEARSSMRFENPGDSTKWKRSVAIDGTIPLDRIAIQALE